MNGLIVHAFIKNDDSVLILKRNKWRAGNRLNAEPEKWDFAGGTVEKGELPKDAVIREVFEETGLKAKVNKIIYESSNYDESKDKVFITLVYECTVLSDVNVKINEEEHSAFEWVKIDEIKEKDYDFVRYIVPVVERCLANKEV